MNLESSTATTAKVSSPTLTPRVGERLTDSGVVTFRDVTAHQLHRMRVEATDKYPPLEAWLKMIGEPTTWTHFYTERDGKVFTGILWLFWKETR